MVENQSGCKIQALRSDNGSEYTSEKFNSFCDEAGIQHQLTAPYTPQQNGVSERRNRYIMEMTRCMLNDKDMPKKLWAEAASTAVFLQNRLPTKALKEDKTPFEVWYGYKPSLKFLKVFGCLCFSQVPQVKHDKLDKKSEQGIFVGYSSVSKAYKVYQPQTEKLIVSRDVFFMENEKWDWEQPQERKQESLPFQKLSHSINLEELEDDPLVRGTRLISDIYQRCNVAVCEPAGFEDANQDQKWKKAMEEEMSMIRKNKTWELVDRPKDRKVIGVKWVFKTKLNADGSINKHKARLVVKGYAQVFGIDYSDTFSPVARIETIRLILAIAAQNGWKVFQLDVKSAFLNGILERDIFIEQWEGFIEEDHEDKVCLLKKALYGLKQAPYAWYSRINHHFLSLGFEKSRSEDTLYVKKKGSSILVVSLYVDDLLLTGNDITLVDEFKQEMMFVFEMTDLGLITYFLGMEIKQGDGEIFICQKKVCQGNTEKVAYGGLQINNYTNVLEGTLK